MPRIEKLVAKLEQSPRTFAWKDTVSLLKKLGYKQLKASGSRERFVHDNGGPLILLHRPHPENTLDPAAAKYLHESLKKGELI